MGDLALEAAVSGVVLEHVYHVVERDERIVDGNDLDALGKSSAEHNAANATETVDTN